MNAADRENYRAPWFGFGWLWPTKVASAVAWQLQDRVIYGHPESVIPREAAEVETAIIHTRGDIVLLVSMQTSIHRQLVNISRGVWVLGLVAIGYLGDLVHAGVTP